LKQLVKTHAHAHMKKNIIINEEEPHKGVQPDANISNPSWCVSIVDIKMIFFSIKPYLSPWLRNKY